MKKNYAFALVAIVLFSTAPVSFAQNVSVTGKVTGIRSIALRTYCSFSTLFGAKNDKCFDVTKVGGSNVAAIGALGAGVGTQPTEGTGQGNQTPSLSSNAPVAERTVFVQGAPGPQGPQGPAGAPGPSPTFPNMPLVFWSGGGGGSSQTIVNNAISPLPGGALPGQVLTTNATGTPEWQFVTLPGGTSTPSILGSLANIFAGNGLNLATTSTSTTLKLGGQLTEDTSLLQDVFNFSLNRLGFGFFNQGTTTVLGASTSTENTTFTGFSGTEGTQNIFAGLFRKASSLFPTFEVRAFDSATNKEGYSTLQSDGIETGITNGTSTTEISIDVSEIQLSSFDGASSTAIKVTATGGVEFNSSEGSYVFPKMDGAANTFLTTNGAGQLRYETISAIVGTSSTSTINAWGLNGNSGTDHTVNFFGTTDAQDLVVKTNNLERMRVLANGNVGIGQVNPTVRFELDSGVLSDSGLKFSQLNAGSTLTGTALNFLTVDALGKVVLSGLDASVFATTSPAGITGNIQFNQGGVFAANPNLNWDDVAGRLEIKTNTPSTVLDVAGEVSIHRTLSLTGSSTGGWGIIRNPAGNGIAVDSAGFMSFAVNGPRVGVGCALPSFHLCAPRDFNVKGTSFFNGKVGIGTSSPQFALDVTGDMNVGSGTFTVATSGAITARHPLHNGVDHLTLFSPAANGSAIRFRLTGGGMSDYSIATKPFDEGTWAVRDNVSGLFPITIRGNNIESGKVGIFNTNPKNSFSVGGDADISGRLGIGTTTPARQLHVVISASGQVARFENSSAVCNINPSIFLAFNCLSDRSLKKDITNLDTSLALFAKLNPVTYRWNNDDASAPLQYGFIAQEVEQVFPHFVTTDSETGLKSVAFGNLIPLTVKAVAEINTHLGNLSEETTSEKFAESTIFKRFSDAFKALTIAFKDITADKATVKELCLPKSDGTVICLSGDQVAQIATYAGIQTITPAPIEPTPVVPVEEEGGDVSPVDESSDLIVEDEVPAPQDEPAPLVVDQVPTESVPAE